MNPYRVLEDKIVFDCGCSFKRSGKTVFFCADTHKTNHDINWECEKTWQFLSEGLTEGVFQLCSPLGRQWTMKLKPENLEHITALGALLRPGCLESKDEDGISTTIHYERRKNNKEPVKDYHPAVDALLKDTYNLCIYQENMLELAKKIAGFSLQDADILRRGIGKKQADTIAKCKKMFMEKGTQCGILTEKQLEEVWGWIESSQRYAFNRSHARAYGKTGYVTAFEKCHFPLQFYKACLIREKVRDQYVNFVNESKLFNINIYPPDIRHNKYEFYIYRRNIYFGLANIKGLVKKDLEKLEKAFQEKDWSFGQIGTDINWLSFLSVGLESVSSKTAEGLINAGALDCFGISRAKLAYEYERWNRLTDGEKKRLTPEYTSLEDFVCYLYNKEVLRYDGALCKYEKDLARRENSDRIYKTELKEPSEGRRTKLGEIVKELRAPLYNINDTVDSLIFSEENLLGVALTRHKTDEIIDASETASCNDINKGRKGYAVLRVKVEESRAYACKNGQSAGRNMMFLKLSDKTGVISAVAFPDVVAEYQHLLTRGSVVFVSGELSKDSFSIKRVYNVS